MSNWSESDLKKQLVDTIELGWLQHFSDAGLAFGWPMEILLAIASRESNIRNIVGDGGNGFGIMQIDRRSSPTFTSSGDWSNPKNNIFRGAETLSLKRRWFAERFGNHVTIKDSKNRMATFAILRVNRGDLDRISIAAYNCGAWAAYHFAKSADPDKGTAGGDYSADVLLRAAVFKQLLEG